jgi:hypothetical protein
VSTPNTPTILGLDGMAWPVEPRPRRQAHLIEFFAYETIGMPLGMALETGLVERREDGSYWGPEGSRIELDREAKASPPPVSG